MVEEAKELCGVSLMRFCSSGLHPHDLKTSQISYLPIPPSLGIRISAHEFFGGEQGCKYSDHSMVLGKMAAFQVKKQVVHAKS